MKDLFSERYGYTDKQRLLGLNEVPERLRNRIYNFLIEWFKNNEFGKKFGRRKIIEILWDKFLGRPIEELEKWYEYNHPIFGTTWRKDNKEVFSDLTKEIIFSEKWYGIYDLIEFIMREYNPGDPFKEGLNKIFEEEGAQYKIVENLVVPLVYKEENEEVERVFSISDKYASVKNHFKKALELFSKRPTPDYKNSIKESILAMEALVRIITQDRKATLGDLVNKLPIHKALKGALKKLYGWTSDEEGIRHSETGERIVQDFEAEARFMLVICSAFINYIIAITDLNTNEHNENGLAN